MQEIDKNRLSVYIPMPLRDRIVLPFLTPLGIGDGSVSASKLFQNIDFSDFKNVISVSDSISICDVVLIPHDYTYIKTRENYIEEIISQAKQNKKKVILFYYSDSSEDVFLDNVIIVRSSKYASELRDNEILMPAYVESLHDTYQTNNRNKSDKPTVGFVGQASLRGVRHAIIYFIKNYFLLSGAKKSGLYFRCKLIHSFKNHKSIVSQFIIRKFYSGNTKSIEGDVDIIRKEYIQNIIDSDFTLSPKGDGNYSLRFYETLALGRTPIVLNTDMCLPLAEMVDYNECIVSVPLDRTNDSADYFYNYWDHMSNGDFVRMQQKARDVFKQYLYLPRFLEILFSRSFIGEYLK
jgi:hypothetical protein